MAFNILNPGHPIADETRMRSNIRGGDRVEFIGWMVNVELETGKTGKTIAP